MKIRNLYILPKVLFFWFSNFILLLIIFYVIYDMARLLGKKNNDVDTFWVLSWHLTDGRLTEMNGMAFLNVKQI